MSAGGCLSSLDWLHRFNGTPPSALASTKKRKSWQARTLLTFHTGSPWKSRGKSQSDIGLADRSSVRLMDIICVSVCKIPAIVLELLVSHGGGKAFATPIAVLLIMVLFRDEKTENPRKYKRFTQISKVLHLPLATGQHLGPRRKWRCFINAYFV